MLDAMESRLLRELRKRLDEQIYEKQVSIASGGLSDHAAYKAACGRITGMRDALAIAEDIERKINGDGDR